MLGAYLSDEEDEEIQDRSNLHVLQNFANGSYELPFDKGGKKPRQDTPQPQSNTVSL